MSGADKEVMNANLTNAGPVNPPPEKKELESIPNVAQKVLAFIAILTIVYIGKIVLVTLLFSILLSFVLEPIVGFLEHRRIARPYGAGMAMLVLMGVLYAMSYFFYVKVESFASELPKYSGQIKNVVVKFRQKADKLDQTRQQIMPDKKQDKNTVTVKSESSGLSAITPTTSAITEAVLALSFIPFLAYFMLTWQAHVRASAVKLFEAQNRTTAYVTISRIAQMLRSFIVGNLVIGLIVSAISAGVFAAMGIPYFYFIGLISGYLSLVPYLGVILAVIPPAAAGIGVVGVKGLLGIGGTVLAVHLFAMNVLYPKMLGRRLQLNPLVVTVSLLFWGFIWGALGLLLAIPVTAGLKIICDHVDGWQAIGELMGEGPEDTK